jgi:hypothetical protein
VTEPAGAAMPGALITVKDLYIELHGMREDMTRLAVHMEKVDTRNEVADRERSDHEARLRLLERFRYTLLGASSLVGASSGVIAALISARIIGK